MSNTKAGGVEKSGFSFELSLAVLLSHPIRTRAFVALTERPASATQLMRAFGLDNVKQASYHIEKLEKAGLVEEVGSRPVHGSVERFYRACRRPIVRDEEWAAMTPEARDDFTRYILRLHVADIALAVDAETFNSRLNRCLIRIPMVVDNEGFAELNRIEDQGYDQRLEVQARSAERMSEREARGEDRGQISVNSITMFFEAAIGSGELGVLDKDEDFPFLDDAVDHRSANDL